ncbi:MAG: ribosomal protein L23/L15e core domain-containing protein [Piptocephalis tieghemiana]|nr:MAG: ribosomal protein L23/L15e core domain-containing protein [Piptocephalis tieghemiana]
MATSSAKKAQDARKAALKGTNALRSRKIRTTTTFYRPKTLRLPRAPKYARKSIPSRPRLDQFSVIKGPLNTESTMKSIEENNTLVFLVDTRASKNHIKDAVKRMYDADALKINTLIRPDGQKKAFVRLTPDMDATDVANKIGLI